MSFDIKKNHQVDGPSSGCAAYATKEFLMDRLPDWLVGCGGV